MMECKVKIGSAYEPKWFERRQTNGWYSAKNIPHDSETVWLQNAMLGSSFKRRSYAGWFFVAVAVVACFLIAYY